jgi:hypothetical protein
MTSKIGSWFLRENQRERDRKDRFIAVVGGTDDERRAISASKLQQKIQIARDDGGVLVHGSLFPRLRRRD